MKKIVVGLSIWHAGGASWQRREKDSRGFMQRLCVWAQDASTTFVDIIQKSGID